MYKWKNALELETKFKEKVNADVSVKGAACQEVNPEVNTTGGGVKVLLR